MLFRALIWRPWKQYWGRTLLSLGAVALGVAVVVAIRVANRSAIASFQQTTRGLAGGADLLVTGPEPLPASLLAQLIPLSGQAEFIPYLDRLAFNPRAHDTLPVIGLDMLGAAAFSSPLPDRAAAIRSGGLPSILLPRRYAAAHNLRAGGTVDLASGGRAQRFRIAALLPSGAAGGGFALIDLPDAEAFFHYQQPPAFDGLRVFLAPGTRAAGLAARLRGLIPAADTMAPPQTRNLQNATMLAAFRANLAALSYVSLLIGLFLVYNTVSISVVRRRMTVATLRALGASRRRVLAVFLAEGGALALMGGLLGIGLGWLLAAAAVHSIVHTINDLYAAIPAGSAALHLSDAIVGLALALAAGVLAAWSPAREAAGLAPAQALRAGSAEAWLRRRWRWAWVLAAALGVAAVIFAELPAPGPIPVWGYGSALAAVLAWAVAAPPLLGVLLPRLRRAMLRAGHLQAGLAAGSLAGALRRSSVLTAALAVAVGVMLGVTIMVGSFRQTVSVWIGQQLQADVFVRSADWSRNHPTALAPGLLQTVAATPGLAALQASRTQVWQIGGQPISLNTRWFLKGSAPGPQYRFLAGADGPVIVSEPLARRLHIAPGDSVSLISPVGPVSLPVAGVFYDYATDHGLLVLNHTDYLRYFGAARPTELGLYATAALSPAQLQARVQNRLYRAGFTSGLDINDNAALRAEAMRVFDQTFRVTEALEFITLLVAVLGVANTLLAVVLERAPELALLRCLGAASAQIRGILLAEAATLASLALALGWGMGLALAWILIRVINVQSFGWTIQFHLAQPFLITASALVWLATVAAAWFPAQSARRFAGTAMAAMLESE